MCMSSYSKTLYRVLYDNNILETMIDDVNKNKKLYSSYVTLYTRLIISNNYGVYMQN